MLIKIFRTNDSGLAGVNPLYIYDGTTFFRDKTSYSNPEEVNLGIHKQGKASCQTSW